MSIKFAFVAACFVIAALSYFRRCNTKNWAWLTAGLLFTVTADYFLVLHNNHLPGVAVFCFAHVCYIFRGLGDTKRGQRLGLFVLPFVALAVLAAFVSGALLVLTAIYAGLFMVNIAVNIRFFRQKDAPVATTPQALPKLNKALTLAGLVLFALCDVNVMLFNLPRELGIGVTFPFAFTLIWVFYLPSQLLLAVSGIMFSSDVQQSQP